jgi:hypothetical protein
VVIIKDNRLFEKYESFLITGFLRTLLPSTIAIHGTPAQSAAALVNWQLSGERDADYRDGRGMYNWIICRDGKITQTIPEHVWTHHAHAGRNIHSIMFAVCLINNGPDNTGDYTAEQYTALNWLIFEYITRRFPIDRIITHDASRRIFAPQTSGMKCPGDKFDFHYIENEAVSRDMEISRFSPGYYKIGRNPDEEGV